MILPYKSVNIESYDEIQAQLTEILSTITDTITTTAYPVDEDFILDQVPQLRQFLLTNSLVWDVGRFFTTDSNDSIPIHKDGNDEHPKFLALNLPLFGCNNSLMHWWDNVEIDYSSSTYKYGKNIKMFSGSNKVITHSLELSIPHLVRIDLPHNVANLKDSPRAILSIRFKPEPLHLWY